MQVLSKFSLPEGAARLAAAAPASAAATRQRDEGKVRMSVTRLQEPEDVARLLPGQPGTDAHVAHDDFPLVVAKVLGVAHVVALGAIPGPGFRPARERGGVRALLRGGRLDRAGLLRERAAARGDGERRDRCDDELGELHIDLLRIRKRTAAARGSRHSPCPRAPDCARSQAWLPHWTRPNSSDRTPAASVSGPHAAR